MEFLEALHAIADRTRFTSEQELLDVKDAFTTALTVPEPLDTDDNGNVVPLNADAGDKTDQNK